MKSKKVIITCVFLLVIFSIIGIGIILLLGYYGLIPSVSKLLKTDKPRDLGISVTEEARNYNIEKLGETTTYSTEGEDITIQYVGETQRDVTFNSEQLTTLAQDVNWKYEPISDLQIRLGNNGSIEGSGMLHVDKIKEYVSKNGGDTTEIDKVIEQFGLSGKSFPFYVQLNLSAENNEVVWESQVIEVGRFKVPAGTIEPYKDVIDELINNRLKQIPNLYIDKIEIDDGKVNFVGTTPEYQVIHKD